MRGWPLFVTDNCFKKLTGFIIIIPHQLGPDRPFRPCLIVHSKVLQVVFVHLVCNSALFLPSCCCSYLLHVVANLICICLVSHKVGLLTHYLYCVKPSKTHFHFSDRLIRSSQRTLPTQNTTNRRTPMPSEAFEPEIPGIKQPKTNALDRATSGTSNIILSLLYIYSEPDIYT